MVPLALIVLPTASAQVNLAPLVEFAKEPGVGFDGQGRFGFAVGNVQLLDLGADVALHVSRPFAEARRPKRPGAWFRDRFVLFGTYSRRTVGSGDDRAVVLDSILGHVRYTRMFVPGFGAEAFGQVGDDVVLDLDLRALAGGGLRLALEGSLGRLWAGAGYLLEFEDRAAGIVPEQVLNHRLNTYLSVEIDLVDDKLDLLGTTYLQPSFRDWRDVQLLQEGKLRVGVTEALAFGFEGQLRVDTQPPDDLVPIDVRLMNSIEVHLRGRKRDPDDVNRAARAR